MPLVSSAYYLSLMKRQKPTTWKLTEENVRFLKSLGYKVKKREGE